MQQVVIETIGVAQALEQLGHRVQRLPCIPPRDRRQGGIGRFIEQIAPAHAVSILHARNPGLRADCLVSHRDILADRVHRRIDIRTVGMAIDHDPIPAFPAEQVVERHSGRLGLDVPQRHVDCRDRPHRHRPAPPVCAAIKELPDILDPPCVLADQRRADMVFKIGHDRQFAPVERCIADAGQAAFDFNLQRDEIAPRARHDHARRLDLHDLSNLPGQRARMPRPGRYFAPYDWSVKN